MTIMNFDTILNDHLALPQGARTMSSTPFETIAMDHLATVGGGASDSERNPTSTNPIPGHDRWQVLLGNTLNHIKQAVTRAFPPAPPYGPNDH